MSRKYSYIITALFCLFVFSLAVASLAAPKRAFSELENRNLQPAPEFSRGKLLSGRLMKDTEEYLSDHFILRDGWVVIKTAAERASGKRENGGVYFASGDALIPRVPTPDGDVISKNIEAVNALCEGVPTPVYLAIIPTKACVWRDRLPYGAPTADEEAYINDICKRVSAEGIDLVSPLSCRSDEYIYYLTDHHWTSLGAYYAADAIVRAMGRAPLSPLKEAVTVSDSFYGTSFSYAGASRAMPDRIDVYIPGDGVSVTSNFTGKEEVGSLYVREKLEGKNKYAFFLGGSQPLCVINTGAQGPRVVLIRDSYSDCLAPFLTESFSQIHLIDLRFYKASVREYIEENDIDEVLIIYGFSSFAESRDMFLLKR